MQGVSTCTWDDRSIKRGLKLATSIECLRATPRSGAMIPVPAGVGKVLRSVVAQRKERAQVQSSTDRLCC